MAVGATEIFRIHPECFNKEVYDFLFREKDPFCFEQLRLIRSVGESQALNKMNGQAIIISASGMCEAGRILHHLANNIGDPKNTVLFVGYCAEHTLGRKIMDGWKEVPILGKQYPVRARIREMDSFSGHADHGELLEYLTGPGAQEEYHSGAWGGEGYPGSGGGAPGASGQSRFHRAVGKRHGALMFRNIEFLRCPHAFRAFVLRFCVQRRIHRQPSNQVMTSGWLRWPLDPVCLRG